jgi:hypothetical protein
MKPAKKTLFIFFVLILTFVNTMAQLRTDSLPVPTPIMKKAFVKTAVQLKTLKPEAGLGDYVKVEVGNIEALLEASRENKQNIVLYFNEIPMHGINADFISARDNTLIFQLTRDTLSMKSWNIFYQGQSFESRRQVRVSVGFENDGSLESAVKDFSLVLVRKHLFFAVLAGMIVLIVLFILLVRKTGIIRDDDSMMGRKAPYSLSRSQLAFWTFVIVFSFLYIYIVTGEMPPITGSTLVLLTTSMATAAGAKIISTSKNPDNKMGSEATEGFFRDLISDHNSVSIHRFQMVVWTFILGVFFLRSVVKSLAMPQFDESMLILMGISSGTYLGLKIPEKKATDTVAGNNTVENETDTNTHHETPPVG